MATRKRHTPEQIVRKLGQADRLLGDGGDVTAVCRELQISEQTYDRWRNGYVESFNTRLRDECLNITSFYSLLHAQAVIGDWKTEYNQ